MKKGTKQTQKRSRESVDTVHGRLMESIHTSGYTLTRAYHELEWLLDQDRWKQISHIQGDAEEFLASISLSEFKFGIEQRKALNKRLQVLGVGQRAIAKLTGVDQKTVSNDLREENSSPATSKGKKPKGTNGRTSNGEENSSPVPYDTDATGGQRAAVSAGRQVAKEQAAAETKARREASQNAGPRPDGFTLRIGDAREVLADVQSDSVHLVLTDPPYGDEAAPLYEWLAEWSARVLVPGGSLICFTGQSRFDRDMRILAGHLRYWWTLMMPHNQAQRLPGKFVMCEFKPILWFVKDHRRGRTLVNDVLRSDRRDKGEHAWGQGDGGVELLIQQLTDPDELIVDPFAGTGRWGKIAVRMGRVWLGADVVAGGDTVVVKGWDTTVTR